MSAVYDPSVKLALWRYEQALIQQGSIYNVSRKRRLEKLSRLRNYLQSLGNTSSDSFQVCDKIELGQIIVNRECLDPTLKITYYKDESGTQWSISFFRISSKVVRIHRIKQTTGVDESRTPKKKLIRLTESELKRVISESIQTTLKEGLNLSIEKDSFQAKPKKKGRLNDWEIQNIFSRIISDLVCAKRITPEDGEMLLYYGLYNNDCVSHLESK